MPASLLALGGNDCYAYRRLDAQSSCWQGERELPISDVLSRISQFVPLSKRLLLIVWPFLAIVIFLLLLAMGAIDILSAGRAYVGGESLWSKVQKDAVYYLNQYAQSKDEEEYLKFRGAISVPLGDSRARI